MQKYYAPSMYIETDSDVKYNRKKINVKILAFLKTILQVCLELSGLKKVKGRDRNNF